MNKQLLSFGLSLLLLFQTALPLSASAESEAPQAPPIAQSASPDLSPDESFAQTTVSADPTDSTNLSYSMEISEAGVELIKSFEGFTAYPIWDYKQYSYGYGSRCDASTVYADPNSPTGYSTTLYPDGIPEREAAKLLKEMVDGFNVYLNNMLEKYKIRLNQNQFDALASFAYNLGPSCWNKTDHSLRNAIVSGDYTEESLTEIFGRYCHAGGNRLEALYKRRMREAAIFFSPYDMSDPNADLYVVNTTSSYLIIRESPSRTSAWIGQVNPAKVIRVHKYSDDGAWAFTSYCGYYGWVDMRYLVSINEDAMVSRTDATGRDDAGLTYTFDPLTMSATLGTDASPNSSGYDGSFAGEVYLTPYVLHDGAIYRLTAISDSAFTQCDSIRTIYIPSSVASIGSNAFTDSSLETIYYNAGSYAEEYAKNSPFTATDLRCKTGHVATKWTVIIQGSATEAHTEEMICSLCGKQQLRYHVGIEIVSYPTKTEYKLGNAFNAKGLTIRALYSDGTTASISDFTLSGYDPNTLGQQTITVTHCIFSTTFTVEVSERKLSGISISAKPKKLTYIEGQEIDYTGLTVKANYDDGSYNTVAEYSISGYDKNVVGKQTITVTYNGLKATFTVTVKAKSVTKVQILNYPYTMEYFCGEKIDTDGLSLKITYDNGTTETIDSGYTLSGYDRNTPGRQKVKVKFGGKYAKMYITVILNYLSTDSLTIRDGYIQPIDSGLTVAEFREYFESGDRIEVLRNGRTLPDDALVSTGCAVRLIYNGHVQDSAILLIRGDFTEDGKCGFTDFLILGDYLMGKREFTDSELAVADINQDGTVTLTDYYLLYQKTQTTPPAERV